MSSPLISGLFRLSGEATALCLRGAAGYEAHLTAEGWLVLSGELVADLNVAMIYGGTASEERLRDFGARVLRRGLPALLLTGPDVSDDIAATAREFHFAPAGAMPMMILEPQGDLPVHSGYEIEIVTAEAGRVEAVEIVSRAYGVPFSIQTRAAGPPVLDAPGVSIFLGRKNGEAVSVVTMTRSGPVVGIWRMATLPEKQRQGAASALLARAINRLRADGVERFYLYSTEPGYPLYRSMGFDVIAEVPIWVREHVV